KSGTGDELEIGREVHPWFAPYGLFEAQDGWLAICVATDPHWQAMCRAAGWGDLAADSRVTEGMNRASNFTELVQPRLEAWLSGQSVDEAVSALASEGVPVAPLQRAGDLLRCPQAESRDMLVDVLIADTGSIRLAGNPVRVEPRTTSHASGYASPGADNEAVFEGLKREVSVL